MKKQQQAPETTAAEKPSGRRTLYQSLHLMTFRRGVVLGMLLIAVSIPVGNWRELSKQTAMAQQVWDGLTVDGTPVPKAEQLSMTDILAGRVADAANLISIMERYKDVAVSERAALGQARDAMQRAVEPAAIRTANAALQDAMNVALKALYAPASVTAEDQRLVTQVVDSFNDHGFKLRVRVRDYDWVMQKALGTYNSLPARMLLAKPELFGEL